MEEIKMYEANEKEREILIKKHDFTPQEIDEIEKASDIVRQGTPVSFPTALVVAKYQGFLQDIRKANKKWWEFWK